MNGLLKMTGLQVVTAYITGGRIGPNLSNLVCVAFLNFANAGSFCLLFVFRILISGLEVTVGVVGLVDCIRNGSIRNKCD